MRAIRVQRRKTDSIADANGQAKIGMIRRGLSAAFEVNALEDQCLKDN